MPSIALPFSSLGLLRTPRQPPAPRWERRPTALVDEKLQRFTLGWFKSLPDAMKPVRCARHYPRVLNQIAQTWAAEAACLDYLDSLLADRRGNRRGFGYGVVTELRRLRAYRIALRPDRHASDDESFARTERMGLD